MKEQIKSNILSKGFTTFSNNLKKYVTLFGVLRFISDKQRPIIKLRDIKVVANNLQSAKRMKYGIIMYDTETIGLAKKTKGDKKRNQIVELAAITYNSLLNPHMTLFHGKISEDNLNEFNSPKKMIDILQIHKGIKITEEDLHLLKNLLKKYGGYKIDKKDYDNFFEELPSYFKEVKYEILKLIKIILILEFNKADKSRFKNVLNSNAEYDVDFFDNEILLIERFLEYIKTQETLLQLHKVILFAQNKNYDNDMVLGSIEDSIAIYKDKTDKKSVDLYNRYTYLLEEFTKYVADSKDTQDVFKILLNKKMYLDKINAVQKDLGINLNVMEHLLTSTAGKSKRSVSLGKLNPFKSSNKEWHTATNDVYVTIETLKSYATIPIILSSLMALSDNKSLSKEIDEAMPEVIKEYFTKINFKNLYKNVAIDTKTT